MIDMLSHPTPSEVSWAIILSNKFSASFWISSYSSYKPLAIYSVISLAVKISHIPSQPSTKKESSSINSFLTMSGFAVMIYSSVDNSMFFLYSKSPMALVRLRFSHTLPSRTYPPALVILLYSTSQSGLWSSDKDTISLVVL